MTNNDFNLFCNTFPAATHVVQWRGSHVWKVGQKVFAIGVWSKRKYPGITFKVTETAYELLSKEPGCRPAPYFASRGMKWIQDYGKPGLCDSDLKLYLIKSYDLVSRGLTKKARKALALCES